MEASRHTLPVLSIAPGDVMKNARLAALLIWGVLCSASSAFAQAPGSEDDENVFRFYGIFNPRFIASTGAVESYSQPNAAATTAAGNPVISVAPDRARYTFQVAQSRVGFWLNEKGPLRAQLEFDFVDFSKATPTVASLPRVRVARVDYSFLPGHTLALGQDWDLHAPVNPHGINLVGALFQAGNTAFMRQQFKYFYSNASGLELGAAVGFPTSNNSPKEAAFEIGALPTLAVRGLYKFGRSRVGASAIATRMAFNMGAEDERAGNAFSTALFSEFAPSARTDVRVELNYGQNSANLGLLTLANGHASADPRELGGFVSVRQVVTGPHAIFGMAGYQKVLEPSKVAPSYGYAVLPPGEPPAFSSAALRGTGPGMLHNGTVRLGYEFRPGRRLAFMVEGFLFRSRFRLHEVDMGRIAPVRASMGIETGALLSF
jgi:hypothetical protein